MLISNDLPIEIPIIFLAFANDRVNNAHYLRNLSNEQRMIRNALSKAENDGLCQIVERSNASVDDILDVFQDKRYNGRIVIFHYGGHADGYKLLLESFSGGSQPAFREGLVSFFSRQIGLKLIFLNACSTEEHAQDLINAGLPSVIGTSQAIDDEVATNLSARFYNGIGNGLSIQRSWFETQDKITIAHGERDFSHLYNKTKHLKYQDPMPWRVFYKPGADKIKDWNLPEAAHDPLFNLPPIPIAHSLPETPFLFLKHYQRKHAEIFFGRSYVIRELYTLVTQNNSSPVILLYGQSGVGKSSLLDAGLLPRIENSHNVLYARRDQEEGLSRTLEEILDKQVQSLSIKSDHHSLTPPQKWEHIELNTKKPFVIILDQVEEVFARPNYHLKNELEQFTSLLKTIFEAPARYPKGKLLLAYRKEYHPDIDEKFKQYEIDRSHVFIKPLERKDIIDVVTGLTREKRLRDRYSLEIDPLLPSIIADHLLEDSKSPIAPVLQIILTRMWDSTTKNKEKGRSPVLTSALTLSLNKHGSPLHHFTIPLYLELKKEGLLLSDFFHRQMEALAAWNNQIVKSGLALDLLKYHTTSWNTAYARDIEEINQTYRSNSHIIPDLIVRLKNLYLLADTNRGKHETGLAHDTLAPVVINEYNTSDKPGQRAARVLAAKIDHFEKDNNTVYLDETDLSTVELGKNGMRDLTPQEKKILEASRKRKADREHQAKRNKTIRKVSVIIIFIVACIAVWQWMVASRNERINKADLLSYQAQDICDKNSTQGFQKAQTAWSMNKNNITTKAIHAIFRDNCFYKIIARCSEPLNKVCFSVDGRYIIATFDNGNIREWNLKGEEIKDLKRVPNSITISEPSHDNRIPLGSNSSIIRLRDETGNIISELNGHNGRISANAFSPDQKYILTGSTDKTARLWTFKGIPLQVFKGHEGTITSVAFSPNGKYILTGSEDKTLRLWELKDKEIECFDEIDGEIVFTFFSQKENEIFLASTNGIIYKSNLKTNQKQVIKDFKSNLTVALMSPGGKRILAGFSDGVICLIDMEGNELWRRDNHRSPISSLDFSKVGKYFITGSYDKTARLWDIKGNEFVIFKGHTHRITSVAFSPDGKYILTGSYDKTARLWDRKGKEVKVFADHTDWVTAVSFCPSGESILTGAGKKIVRWKVSDGSGISEFKGHENIVQTIVFSPDGKYILTGSTDKTAILWNLNGERLQEFKGHDGFINSVSFSPDSKYILTGSSDCTARLWKIYLLERFLKTGVYEKIDEE